jgi:co-chaperonin GroES (HSP10)
MFEVDLTNVMPRGNLVLVLLDPVKKTTAGGLHLPDQVKQKQYSLRTGHVVRVGPGQLLQDGTRVPIELTAGTPVVIDGGAVIGKVDDEEARHVLVEANGIAGTLPK